jgi:Protein of unknown function (DUF2384)
VARTSRNTQLDATIQLPDGRLVPAVVTIDLRDIEPNGAANDNPDSLLLRAVEVFGKADKAVSWLGTANPAVGGKSPREAASTEDGRRAVLDVLLDLEHGFPA